MDEMTLHEELTQQPEKINSKGKKCLITGGAGFIGSHVAKHCLDLGMEVVVIDNFSGGFEENIPDCRWMPMDVTDADSINRLFSSFKFDYVFHIAADARENLSHFTAHHCYMNNLIGSVNIINACINHDVKCIAFTSSIAVMAGAEPPYEEGDPFRALDPYGISKAGIEIHLHKCLNMFGLNHVIFRPFNVYGPGQNIGDKYRNVIGIFMNQIMQGKQLTIFGDGEQTRSFSYIDDVAPHIARSVLRPELYNSTFFIGGAKQYTVNELAHVVAAEFGVLPDIKYLQQRHEARTAYANTDLARSAFGPATVDLEEGVKRMAEWARAVGPRRSKDFDQIEIRKNLPEGW